MKRTLATLAIAAAATLSLASPASAAPPVPQPVNAYNQMRLTPYTYNIGTGVSVVSDCSVIHWFNGPDAPTHLTNDRKLTSHLCQPNPGVSSEFAVFETDHGDNLSIPINQVKNLAFDTKIRGNATQDAGSPRISVDVDTDASGTSDLALYLSPFSGNPAFECKHPFTSGGPPEWYHSNFTGFKNNCSFFDSNGVTYSADGTHSAFKVFAIAHPGAVVTAEYGVEDASGFYSLDNIEMVNRLYTVGPNKAIFCGSTEYGTVC